MRLIWSFHETKWQYLQAIAGSLMLLIEHA